MAIEPTNPAGEGQPSDVSAKVGYRLVRFLTDDLSNIDAFVDEHGLDAVMSYLEARWQYDQDIKEYEAEKMAEHRSNG